MLMVNLKRGYYDGIFENLRIQEEFLPNETQRKRYESVRKQQRMVIKKEEISSIKSFY